jgi:hypothetical protein
VIAKLQVGKKSLRQAGVSVVRARNGTRHGGDGVSVVTAVHSSEERLLEVLRRGQEAPEGAWERAQDIGPIVPGGEGGLAGGQILW